VAASALLVGAVAVSAGIAGVANQFVNDDTLLIELNDRVQDLAQVRTIVTSPYWPPPFSQDLYRPLTSIFHALQFVVGNGDPLVYRLVSYGLYALTSIAVLLLARRLVSSRPALVAALIFAAHPVHVEAVALAVGQAELMVALIAITTTGLYVEWRRSDALTGWRMVQLAALYAVASLFKENGLVIPGLWLGAELLLISNQRRSAVAILPISAATGLGVLAVRRAVLHQFVGTTTTAALVGVGVRGRALTMLSIVPQWLRLAVWPAHLRADYSPQEFAASTGFGATEFVGVLIVAATIGLVVLAWRRMPALAFGLWWMIVALLPVSNVVIPTGVLLAECTLFLPSVGLAIGMAALADRLPIPYWRREAIYWVVGLVCFAGILRSAERQRVWRSEGLLTVRTVKDAPKSFRAQRDYGNTLYEIGHAPEGQQAYERAIALAPASESWAVRNELARHFRETGKGMESVDQLRRSLAAEPRQPRTRADLVAVLLWVGDYDGARAEADTAIGLGGLREVFGPLRSIADSARRVGAPAGSVNIGVQVGRPPNRPALR